MYCRKCGAELPGDSVFCHLCGAQTVPVPAAQGDTAKKPGSGIVVNQNFDVNAAGTAQQEQERDIEIARQQAGELKTRLKQWAGAEAPPQESEPESSGESAAPPRCESERPSGGIVVNECFDVTAAQSAQESLEEGTQDKSPGFIWYHVFQVLLVLWILESLTGLMMVSQYSYLSGTDNYLFLSVVDLVFQITIFVQLLKYREAVIKTLIIYSALIFLFGLFGQGLIGALIPMIYLIPTIIYLKKREDYLD
ncbi:zinc ribbon domain-containing protein [Feifania hominis]|uniref:Zinc ribbon domain-containing protein n=1 Tax=Feifania hominis TaxID=2763660 RepID=A0A926DEE3_9FIRM|nr:zinc ribbon domain-containing protein [Feifania hominis]MBC8537083.1 zinc ribbon domain-containing protein [Feifania hominis]